MNILIIKVRFDNTHRTQQVIRRWLSYLAAIGQGLSSWSWVGDMLEVNVIGVAAAREDKINYISTSTPEVGFGNGVNAGYFR